jgi:hypothetical protein
VEALAYTLISSGTTEVCHRNVCWAVILLEVRGNRKMRAANK